MKKNITILILLIMAISAVGAAAKSYQVNAIHVQAEAKPNGDLRVEERLTYAFDGSFSFAFRDIPLKRGEMVAKIMVSEEGSLFANTASEQPGTFTISKTANNVRVTWHYAAKNESRTFTLAYTLSGVIKRYSDVAVLYYQFVGDNWDRAIGDVSVRVTAPHGASSSNVRAWAHGPLYGLVDIEADGVVRLTVRPLPARTFWEGRILYPTGLFPEMTMENVAMRERIFEEEGRWVEEANRRRVAHQRRLEERAEQRERQRELAGRLGPVSWILCLAGVAMWFMLYRRYGTAYEVRPLAARGEIPSDHAPAIVSYLVNNKSVGAPAIVATLLDLANRGYLEIEEVTREKKSWLGGTRTETDYRFFTGEKTISGLERYEKDLLDFLFNRAGTGTEFTLSGVKKTASKNRRAFQKWFMEWIKYVKEHGAKFGFYDPIAVGPIVLTVVAGIILFGGGILLSVMTETAAGVPAILVGVILSILAVTLRRHSPDGRRLALEWRAFRTHLRKISKALGPVRLSSDDWSRYLAVAILFGMHKKLLPRIEIAGKSGHPIYPVWYHTALGSTGGDLASLADGFSGMVSTMSSTMSSASGTGGGASGGGGGGSGGGGGGAG